MTAIMELFSVINIQTAIFLIGVSVLIQSGLIWLQSLMIQEYRGIRTAALGNLLFGIGMLLTAFRGIVADFLSIILANYLVAIGTAALYVAVCRFINERFRYSVIAAAILPVLILLPYFTFVKADFVVRVVIMGFSGVILIGAMAFHLFRLRHGNFRFSALFLTFVSLVYAIVLLLRSIGLLIYPTADAFSPNPILVLHSIALFASSFLWSMGFVLMVSQRLQTDLNELATVDSLTRIPNRRAMVALLEAEFARKSRIDIGFSVMLVDVDHFKIVNDRYGHEMGDIVLHDLAQRMREALRGQDFISRWGGEEFLILLPATSLREATEIGERLRTLVEQSHFRFDGHQVSLTISVGIGNSAACPDLDKIYKCADLALYKAKLTRNAVAWNDMSIE
jgi:diguanylate cyclase (GGDEF)-like protein